MRLALRGGKRACVNLAWEAWEGFTKKGIQEFMLIGLLIVIAIIGILVTVLIADLPNAFDVTNDAAFFSP